jgi:lysophospholipase L1-like esterase
MLRRWHAAVLAILAAFALACEGAGGAPPAGGGGSPGGGTALPSSIAALGDSITAGYGSCVVVVGCQHNSWSTGGARAVDSHYRRIERRNSAIRDRRDNFAVPGARAAGLAAQANAAVRAGAAYVTVLIGANDICRAATVDAMTEPAEFRAQVDRALDRLADGLPRATVLVASVPDLHRLWEIGRGNDAAVRAWARGICPALLADPRSTDPADSRRRRTVDRRVDAYNRELAAACRAYGRACRWDEGATHRIRFTLAQVGFDYFHPNASGQARLADATFPRRWR